MANKVLQTLKNYTKRSIWKQLLGSKGRTWEFHQRPVSRAAGQALAPRRLGKDGTVSEVRSLPQGTSTTPGLAGGPFLAMRLEGSLQQTHTSTHALDSAQPCSPRGGGGERRETAWWRNAIQPAWATHVGRQHKLNRSMGCSTRVKKRQVGGKSNDSSETNMHKIWKKLFRKPSS